ncbi:MAG: DnaJ domain-containing protein [Acidobacteriota bacterium]
MKAKDIKEMNLYEVMNVSQSASQQDIERAYQLAQSSYEKNSLAHYTVMDEDQRKKILERIEKAYRILRDPEKRREYDLVNSKNKSEVYYNSYFRNSTERLFIEDGDKVVVKVIKNIKKAFSSVRQKKSDP